jgi:predicted CXXCH cytochrome family protein
MDDWIDREHANRASGHNAALTQSQHAECNARYPGMTLQMCETCGEPTGFGDGGLFVDDFGPLCNGCHDELNHPEAVRLMPSRETRQLVWPRGEER